MKPGLSPDLIEYLQAIESGKQVIYHAGTDSLSIFKDPFYPVLHDEPFPYAIAALFHQNTKNSTYVQALGFCFFSIRNFFKHGGRSLLPYLASNTLATSAFLSCYQSDMQRWAGWNIENNSYLQEARLKHNPQCTICEMQNQLDLDRNRNEEIFSGMWKMLQAGELPSKLSATAFQRTFD